MNRSYLILLFYVAFGSKSKQFFQTTHSKWWQFTHLVHTKSFRHGKKSVLQIKKSIQILNFLLESIECGRFKGCFLQFNQLIHLNYGVFVACQLWSFLRIFSIILSIEWIDHPFQLICQITWLSNLDQIQREIYNWLVLLKCFCFRI